MRKVAEVDHPDIMLLRRFRPLLLSAYLKLYRSADARHVRAARRYWQRGFIWKLDVGHDKGLLEPGADVAVRLLLQPDAILNKILPNAPRDGWVITYPYWFWPWKRWQLPEELWLWRDRYYEDEYPWVMVTEDRGPMS